MPQPGIQIYTSKQKRKGKDVWRLENRVCVSCPCKPAKSFFSPKCTYMYVHMRMFVHTKGLNVFFFLSSPDPHYG